MSVGQNRERLGAIMFGTLARGGSGIVASMSCSVDAAPIAVAFCRRLIRTESSLFCGSITIAGFAI